MKLRATVVIDFELADQQAHEKFGAIDPMTVAQSMQVEAEKGLTEHFSGEPSVVHASCTVHPVYG